MKAKIFITNKIISIFLIAGMSIQIISLVLIPQQANAQLSQITGNFGTCAVSGLAGDAFNKILDSLNLESLLIDSALGLIGFGGGDEVPVNDDSLIGLQNEALRIQGSLQTKEYYLDCLTWAVTQGTIETITGSILGWVNTGNSGINWIFGDTNNDLPFYIDDPLGFFSNLSDRVTEDFISDFRNDFDPSGKSAYKDVLASVLTNNRLQKNTLSDVLQPTVDKEFFNDFNAGSWDAYFESVTNPANDPLRLFSALNSIADTRVAAATADQEKLLDYGDGFFPDVDSKGYVVTPGQVIKNQINDVLESGLDQLENADELSELVGVLANILTDSLIGQVIDSPDGSSRSTQGLRGYDTSLLTGDSLQGDENFEPDPITLNDLESNINFLDTLQQELSDIESILQSADTVIPWISFPWSYWKESIRSARSDILDLLAQTNQNPPVVPTVSEIDSIIEKIEVVINGPTPGHAPTGLQTNAENGHRQSATSVRHLNSAIRSLENIREAVRSIGPYDIILDGNLINILDETERELDALRRASLRAINNGPLDGTDPVLASSLQILLTTINNLEVSFSMDPPNNRPTQGELETVRSFVDAVLGNPQILSYPRTQDELVSMYQNLNNLLVFSTF